MMPLDRKRFLFLACAVTVLALLLREYYVLVSQVVSPYSGDAREYIAYAEHLLAGYFGRDLTPDAYRTPGYPAFMALWMLWEGDWYPRVLQAQAVLGTLTVAMTVALGRVWLSRGWALLAGLLLAIWPHHIAATSELLSEVVFGFVLTGSLLLTALALQRRSLPLAICAGLAFGLAYLVNPLIALFPFVAAAVFWRAELKRPAVALVLASLVAVAGWGIRSAAIHGDGSQRAYMNLVQGSWPLYHAAFNHAEEEPMARAVLAAMGEEIGLLLRDKPAGLRAMGDRMGREPLVFARWYAEKPYMLWGWGVRIGAGGVVVHEVVMSPLKIFTGLRVSTAAMKVLNPALFVLSLLFALWALWRGPPAAKLVALLFLYVTGVHTVLQADPRYSTAYRSVELLLVVAGIQVIAQWIAARRQAPYELNPVGGA